jgi:hypothetical protein
MDAVTHLGGDSQSISLSIIVSFPTRPLEVRVNGNSCEREQVRRDQKIARSASEIVAKLKTRGI